MLDKTIGDDGMMRSENALSLSPPEIVEAMKNSQLAWEKALSPKILSNLSLLDTHSIPPLHAYRYMSVPHASGWVVHVLPNPPGIAFTKLEAGAAHGPGVSFPARLPRDNGRALPLPPHDAYQFDPSQGVIAFVSPAEPNTGLR